MRCTKTLLNLDELPQSGTRTLAPALRISRNVMLRLVVASLKYIWRPHMEGQFIPDAY
jgi:hypothetical protein